jgi:hypothetical protein
VDKIASYIHVKLSDQNLFLIKFTFIDKQMNNLVPIITKLKSFHRIKHRFEQIRPLTNQISKNL